MQRIAGILLLTLPLTLAACDVDQDSEGEIGAEAEPAGEMGSVTDQSAAREEIDRIREEWIRAARAGDAAAVAALYTDDARMVGAGNPSMEGRQAIQEGLSFEGVTDMEITSEDTVVGADLAADWGSFSQTVQTPDGEEQTVNGRYLVVVERQDDGTWGISHHLSMTDEGMEPGQGVAGDTM